MDQLGFASLLHSRRSRERDLVVAMVAARVLEPQSKLAITRWWHTTTLPKLLGVFDETNLFELMHPGFPGERLIACRNPDLAALRVHKRQDLLRATREELDKVQTMVRRGRLEDPHKFGVRVGKVIHRYRVPRHFELDIGQGSFSYALNEDAIAEFPPCTLPRWAQSCRPRR
jgi:hypothetical protein